MHLTFLGAAHEVTGSCTHISCAGKNILVDCGMEQGPDLFENQTPPISPNAVDSILLTHAHIDHSGLLPLFYKRGFRGSVVSTRATYDLCEIMLKDSAFIQMTEAEWQSRKAKRAGEAPVEPMYSIADAEGVLKLFHVCDFGEQVPVFPNISARFISVGHLLGASSIELTLAEAGEERKIVFSGDIGNGAQPLLDEPVRIDGADYVVMESTYGDRNHQKPPDYATELARIISQTFERGGNVVIPAFAVGRTQEMLYHIRIIKEKGLVPGFPDFPVYVDSPLAVEATSIYGKNHDGFYGSEANELISRGVNPISFKGLKLSISSDDSKAINFDDTPKVILSASGMCEAGRIKHHLKHNLWREDSTILFVGYQGAGTLGRKILEGAPLVKLFSEEIQVRARIERLSGVSSHADMSGLCKWLGSFESPRPQRVFVIHGDSQVCDAFTHYLSVEHGYNAYAPFSGDSFDMVTGEQMVAASPIPAKKRAKKAKRAANAYLRLVSAGQRIMDIIARSRGLANSEVTKFTEQLNNLSDRWERT